MAVSAPKTKAQLAAERAGASLPKKSKKKTKKTSKAQKKAAASPEKEALVENTSVFPAEGFAEHPTYKEPELRSADYYRYGKVKGSEEKQGDATVSQSIIYEIPPKLIDEFGDSENGSDKYQEASIRMIGKVKNSDKGRDLIAPYTKFILENVQEAHTERSQIVQTFGDFYVFMFGENPPVYNYSGTLFNSKSANWLADFMFLYENYLRGTKCVENRARIILTYAGRQVEGFILGTSNVTNATTDKGAAFSFQMVITDRKILQKSADFGKAFVGASFNKRGEFIALLTDQGLSFPPSSEAYNTVKAVSSAKANPATAQKKTVADKPVVENKFGSKLGAIQATVTGALKKVGVG